MNDMDEQTRSDRLWTWALHEDNLFDSRMQLFLTAHGLLIAAAGFAISSDAPQPAFLWFVASLGVVLALVWVPVQVQSSKILTRLDDKLYEVDSLVKEVFSTLHRKRPNRATRNKLLSWCIPGVVALWWAAFVAGIASGLFL